MNATVRPSGETAICSTFHRMSRVRDVQDFVARSCSYSSTSSPSRSLVTYTRLPSLENWASRYEATGDSGLNRDTVVLPTSARCTRASLIEMYSPTSTRLPSLDQSMGYQCPSRVSQSLAPLGVRPSER